MNPQKRPKKNSNLNTYARFSGIAIQMIAIIGLATYGGVKLDEAYPNKYSVYTIICSLSGVVLAMYYVIRQVLKHSKK